MPSENIQANFPQLLAIALSARHPELLQMPDSAIRLFAGFYEGCKELVVDLFADTLVIHNLSDSPKQFNFPIAAAINFYLEALPRISSVLVKTRKAKTETLRRGDLIRGDRTATKIQENNVRYAIDLRLNQDTSFYLDTRELRVWIKDNLSAKTVLNTFAYTGSLGVAALAGGARRVVQHDRQRRFLNLAKDSYTLNGYTIDKTDFITSDFWSMTARFRRIGEQFDCVILDPPIHSVTQQGKIDMVHTAKRVINKVRPLVSHNGWLIAINNALYVSGVEYIKQLENLGADGYLEIEALVPVPADCTGYPRTIVDPPPANPSPFNHPTKIAILRIR